MTEDIETRGRKARQTREQEQRPVSWRPPDLLPTPDPEEGYSFRWIRISTFGQADVSNTSGRLREGYVPVKASEHPEVHVMDTTEGRFKDCVVYGGLLLCKIPTELARQRDAYYRNQAEAQLRSVDSSLMREQDSRMPIFNERKTSARFGTGASEDS